MWIVGESFDYYGNSADLGRSVWDATGNIGNFGNPSIGTRFGVGNSFNVAVFDNLTKNFGNESTVYLVCAQYRPSGQSGSAVELYFLLKDGATGQCCICFMSNGQIQLRSSSQTGTVLATYNAAFVQDVWTHFQMRVVIDPTNGSFTVRKNGQNTDSFTVSGLNTRGGTANSYVNSMTFGLQNGYQQGHYIDDLLMYSGSGGAPNTWVGDVRAVCLMPAVDTAQKQFATFPTTPASTFNNGGTFIGFTHPANTIVWGPPGKPTRSGNVQKITVNSNGGGPAHVKAAIYLNDGANGAPSTLVAVSNEVLTPASSGLIDFPFAAGAFVSPFRSYYVALLMDTAWAMIDMSNNTTIYQLARSYSSGFPSPASGFTQVTGSALAVQWTMTIGGSAVCLSEQAANSDTDYVYDSTVGDSDLYGMDDLPFSPVSIIGVVSKVFMKKSDAGLRQGQLLVQSGATQVTGPDTVLGTTYTYLSRVDTTDPATGTQWTIAGVNGVQVGQKVTA
jgi:hypothetical protein